LEKFREFKNMENKIKYPYSTHTERWIKMFYESLNEKDRRHYAAIEAHKLDHGGITYISELLNCARSTIHDALEEFKKKMIFLILIKYVMKAVVENQSANIIRTLTKFF
jgi:hypothetical protein